MGHILAYAYGNTNWKDLLTSYNGQNITYDAIGNPLSYCDGMSFTWEGRQLKTTVANSKNLNYTYNDSGIRTSKTVDGVTTSYFLDGSTILAQKTGSDVLWFLYDSDGTRIGFTYNGTAYYYTTNAQGDVTGITDSNCNTVVEYTYDAWGKLLNTTGSMASTVGNVNPFLYRGYYYGSESSLYYLNSRYYDPRTGRFINPDGTNILEVEDGSVIDINLFVYSENNCINNKDSDGNYSFHIPTLGGHYNSGTRAGVWYFGVNAPQKNLGYCDTYDALMWVAGAKLDYNTTKFKYNGAWWRIEVWKGNYAYGKMYGGEVGVYWKTGSSGGMYNSATKNYMDMGISLYYGNSFLFSNWGTTWWLTGFKYGYYDKRYLHIMATITFPTNDMKNAFVKASRNITIHANSWRRVTFLF